jgi:hypothetical protein
VSEMAALDFGRLNDMEITSTSQVKPAYSIACVEVRRRMNQLNGN